MSGWSSDVCSSDPVAVIGAERLGVVQHGPAVDHAAGRGDDHRPALAVERLRLFYSVDEGGHVEHPLAVLFGHVVLGMVGVVVPGRVDCHRAVEVDRHARDVLALAQPGDMQHERLGATDGKGRNDDYAPTGSDAADDGGQLRLLVDRNVFPIALCGFADQYVTGGQGRWRVPKRILLPDQVTTEVRSLALACPADVGDRKSVVEGKRVSVIVDNGWGRIL